ncbi:helix-turn-helix domain-containing protein [Companilactobacillus paralimentarius]|uniref:helix-turn-helix domain-containing protein n=1 Tax=Companilactobacillus paralimentarius TaxID=83526 RepID=UPI001265F64A|nr:helix-turn-helix transcriptional regulator [Companilactobacillus paralimentarius]QFR70119.1 helix-turn-helix domain-containing protein [Companilactobacillus paralimentarius]
MKNNLSMILGSRLISISDVSDNTGLSRTTVTDIYYKRANDFKLSTLEKICDFLQITLSELVEYEPQKIRRTNRNGNYTITRSTSIPRG